jgi:cell division protein FtsA
MTLGISIDGLVLKSLASAEAVLTEDEKHNGVVLVDIGSTTTDVAIFKDGSSYYTSTIPVGGYNVTNDIALGLGIPFGIAEEMKMKHGDVKWTEEQSGDDIVVEGGHSVSYSDLCQIIEARIGELFRLILLQMPQTDYGKATPTGLVITGGSCNLPNIAEFGCELTQLPVRIGIPLNLGDSVDILCDPAYATSIGLLYWQMKNGCSYSWWNRRGDLGALFPRWLNYFSIKNRQLNNRAKERESGKSKLRTKPS